MPMFTAAETVVSQSKAATAKKTLLHSGSLTLMIISIIQNTVDLGVPVISMHAPFEVIAKVDLYEAYRAFSAFNRD